MSVLQASASAIKDYKYVIAVERFYTRRCLSRQRKSRTQLWIVASWRAVDTSQQLLMNWLWAFFNEALASAIKEYVIAAERLCIRRCLSRQGEFRTELWRVARWRAGRGYLPDAGNEWLWAFFKHVQSTSVADDVFFHGSRLFVPNFGKLPAYKLKSSRLVTKL